MLIRILAGAAALLFATTAAAQVHVQGYTRSNGTYVAPHIRSSPSTGSNYGSTYRAPSPQPLYGSSPSSSSSSNACTGLCYGEPSATTGQPRNQTVSGYTRRDGTYVAPYTRSRGR